MATLAELRTRVRQRSDNEHTGQFVTDAEVNGLINTRYKELYELLVLHSQQRAESVQTITVTAATDGGYALNTDFFALLGVYRIDPALGPIWLQRHDHRIMPDINYPADAETYRLVGSYIEFNPIPSSGTYKLKYVPIPTTLSADSDEIDGVLGWEEYVVCGAALDVLVKEEAEEAAMQELRTRLGEMHNRIKWASKQVELSEYPSIAKVRPSAFDTLRLPGSFSVRGYRGPLW